MHRREQQLECRRAIPSALLSAGLHPGHGDLVRWPELADLHADHAYVPGWKVPGSRIQFQGRQSDRHHRLLEARDRDRFPGHRQAGPGIHAALQLVDRPGAGHDAALPVGRPHVADELRPASFDVCRPGRQDRGARLPPGWHFPLLPGRCRGCRDQESVGRQYAREGGHGLEASPPGRRAGDLRPRRQAPVDRRAQWGRHRHRL